LIGHFISLFEFFGRFVLAAGRLWPWRALPPPLVMRGRYTRPEAMSITQKAQMGGEPDRAAGRAPRPEVSHPFMAD
jgi:hypothetical protein